jgi:hypothetical protein
MNNNYHKLSTQNSFLSVEINEFNKTDIKIKKAVTKWKKRLKQKNDQNFLLANETQTLILKYQQKVYVYD